MNKEEVLEEFFKSLKLSLKNASIYNSKHPSFKNSVQDLKENLEVCFESITPLKLSFTPHSLLIEDKYWDKENIHRELARIFHQRKIKSIEFSPGVTREELTIFIQSISLSPKDILGKGGIEKLLPTDSIPHIRALNLDFSLLLKGEGKEIKDIWSYLLQEAVDEKDVQKIEGVLENFPKVVNDLTSEDLLDNPQLHQNLKKLFNYLQGNQKDKYNQCTKDLVKSVIKNKGISPDSDLNNIKSLLTELNQEELASVLKEKILTEPEFDSFSFTLFTKLVEKEKHHQIASCLKEMFFQNGSLSTHPQAKEKIKQILSESSDTFISEIYKNTLFSLLEKPRPEKKFSLKLYSLPKNYGYLLLNLFTQEKEKENYLLLLEKILNNLNYITKEKDTVYLQHLTEAIYQKGKEILSEPVLLEVNNYISNFIEKITLENKILPDIDYFLDFLNQSTVGVDVYFKRIFNDKKVNPSLLRLLFKLFPQSLSSFRQKINEHQTDSTFLSHLARNLSKIDTHLSLDLLKYIFHLGDSSVKIEVVKSMRRLSPIDEDFLLFYLKKGSISLKKECLESLKRNEITKHKAVEVLFSISSPLGIKNKEILENIEIAEKRVSIKQSLNPWEEGKKYTHLL